LVNSFDFVNGSWSISISQPFLRLASLFTGITSIIARPFSSRGRTLPEETLGSFQSFIRDDGFDLGIAHDGDADRIVVVQHDGQIVHEDTILAIIAERYVRASDVDDPVVVTTPNTSNRVDDRVKTAGGRVVRTGLGDLHEGIATVRTSDQTKVVFAAEPWKHIHPGLGPWIDGIASACIIARLIGSAGTMKNLRENIQERPYKKQSVRCPNPAKDAVMEKLRGRFRTEYGDADIQTTYGIRVNLGERGWVLVRPSGTEPVIRVYCESDQVDQLLERTIALIEQTINEK
jgi:phosphomannomutase